MTIITTGNIPYAFVHSDTSSQFRRVDCSTKEFDWLKLSLSLTHDIESGTIMWPGDNETFTAVKK